MRVDGTLYRILWRADKEKKGDDSEGRRRGKTQILSKKKERNNTTESVEKSNIGRVTITKKLKEMSVRTL